MTHDLESTTLAQSQASTNAPIYFVKLELDSGDVLVHSRLGSITFNGDVYLGVGHLGGIDGIEESSDMSRSTVRLTLSGIESSLVSLVLGQHYQGRTASIYAGFVSLTTNALIGTPALIFAGKVDVAPLSFSGETATISLSVENEWADWDKPRIRRYNDADQQARFPGDNFFKFAEQAADKQFFWGKANA